MQDPEIQNILTDPVMRQVCLDLRLCSQQMHNSRSVTGVRFMCFCFAFVQVLIDFQENPKAAQEHTKNPMVMNKIQKLISAGIVQMR